uniref:THAP domain-containing protein 1 n=1 Tax=Monopterus albus TaxID=43700 RepID=A0A3Q3JEE7_MONAL
WDLICHAHSCSTTLHGSISFHHFPKDETLRKIWIRNVRRDNLVIKRTTTVCSRHFISADVIQCGRRRLKEGAVPWIITFIGQICYTQGICFRYRTEAAICGANSTDGSCRLQ